MAIILVQLSDLHAETGKESIVERWDPLCRAVEAELDDQVQACVIVFSGDAAYGGRADQFLVAADLLRRLKWHLANVRAGLPVHILTVPGNHDCDLTSEDSEARNTLRLKVGPAVPAPSTSRVLLEAQKEYFIFAANAGEPGSALSIDSPFYRYFDVIVGQHRVRFHLLNSSWTSILHETDDLRYPLSAFLAPKSPEADYSVTVLHHPTHWFLMPGIRRELRDLIENHSDLVLTGHEHENEASRRIVQDGAEINHLEGGVLYEKSAPSLCTFNVIRFDFGQSRQVIKRLRWDSGRFEPDDEAGDTSLLSNPNRADRRFRLRGEFEEWLDQLEDPLTHPREDDLRLSHIFAYPELQKIVDLPDEPKRGKPDPSKPVKSAQIIQRIRSEEVVAELTNQRHTFITGGDKSGKTSLLKRLFLHFRHGGKAPVMIRAGDISKSGTEEAVRRAVDKAVSKQYQSLTTAEFGQLPKDNRVLLVDEFQDAPSDSRARRRILDYIGERFGSIILVASDEVYVEMVDQRGEDTAVLLSYQRYEISEFHHIRTEELATRWTALGQPDADPAEVKAAALELCEKVESLLAVAGLPHTPWLLSVLIEQAESPDVSVAARNGDYGHLYHAVITVALSRSRFPQFNLNGKFTYLAEFAYCLHRANRSTLRETEARSFHKDFQERFDMPFDYEKVRDDLISTRMLRLDGDELAFRHRYVYAFFVAWWISRNIHRPDVQRTVKELCTRVHHDISSNVLVFLSHLTDNPIVLTTMQEAATSLFNGARRAEIRDDVRTVNKLNLVEGFFVLPPTPPEVNRRLLQDDEDEQLARRSSGDHDGRKVRAVPEDEPTEEVHQQLRELRAALRTIRILGQVLRNKALSMEVPEKVALMDEVLGLGCRILGHIYQYSDELPQFVRTARKRLLRMLVNNQKAANLEALKEKGGDATKEASRLTRTQWNDVRAEATLLANRFWFDLYMLATVGMVKRMANAIGSKLLDPTMERIRQKADTLPNHFVDLASRLHRRGRNVPADELVRLHKALKTEDNRLGRVTLEAIAWERLLLFDTDPKQKQQICEQMGIKVPVQTLDATRKKFGSK